MDVRAVSAQNVLSGPFLHFVIHGLVFHPPGAPLMVLCSFRIVLLHHGLVLLVDGMHLAEEFLLERRLDVFLMLLYLLLFLLVHARLQLFLNSLNLFVNVDEVLVQHVLQLGIFPQLFVFVHLVKADVLDGFALLLRQILTLHLVILVLSVVGLVVLQRAVVFQLVLLLAAEDLHPLTNLDILPSLLVLDYILQAAPQVDVREQLPAIVWMLLHLIERRVLLGPLEAQVGQLLDAYAIWIELWV